MRKETKEERQLLAEAMGKLMDREALKEELYATRGKIIDLNFVCGSTEYRKLNDTDKRIFSARLYALQTYENVLELQLEEEKK